MRSARPNWFFRFKLYHLPFWLVYHYLWWIVTLGNPVKAWESLLYLPYTIKFSFYVVFQALATYFNLYFLLPKYLETSRFGLYGIWLLGTIACATLGIIGGYYFSAAVTGHSLHELYGGDTKSGCFFQFLGNALPSTVASLTLAMSIKLTKNWIQTRQRQQLLEKEKLEAELTFLRNQFNPHFLFNSINSIFFLIHRNPDKASDSLAKFSDLLRYQLYECNDQYIPLSQEITYLINFVELEKLRMDRATGVVLNIDVPPADHLCIAPFVLMSFVENAFKHVSRETDRPSEIAIHLTLEDHRLFVHVHNTTSGLAEKEAVRSGGLGLKNVQRRLDLLYPGKHRLSIRSDDASFDVDLELTLAESVEINLESYDQLRYH
ncbi:sensor histidine kinase [Siphonobacter aquaeclarae]|uniref:Histidine kinase n=1 Tax=Siphonobacter aquaeclarae TaxID=563176 RepID=A0A1G9I743_9BACT|nr:histidine kinase [Siphonobacter aquaeclarae]SDL20865.1 Histidine kinase [Siphonobacter aquaeclarae]